MWSQAARPLVSLSKVLGRLLPTQTNGLLLVIARRDSMGQAGGDGEISGGAAPRLLLFLLAGSCSPLALCVQHLAESTVEDYGVPGRSTYHTYHTGAREY